MTRRNKIVLAAIIGVIVLYFFFDLQCRLGTKCKNCPRYSKTLSDSKRKDVFVSTYKPLTNRVKFRNQTDTVEIISAWAERSWRINHNICLLPKLETVNGFNFTIEVNGGQGEKYSFRGIGDDWGYWTPTILTTLTLTDTLTIQMVDGDQLKFVRER